MKPTKRLFLTQTTTYLLVAAGLFQITLTTHAKSISSEEAHAIGVDAYLYFYPLVTMDITRKQLTNIEHADGINAPMNLGSVRSCVRVSPTVGLADPAISDADTNNSSVHSLGGWDTH